MQGRMTSKRPWFGVLLIALLGLGLAGCSKSQQKVAGSSPVDVLIYDVFGQERSASYYYGIVRDSHDQERFCYQCTDDPYLVDKNIDAVTKLGHANFGRLEGEALVVSKLSEVLLEDPSALAQSNAATSLTQIGARLPRYQQTGAEERGARFIQALETLDAIHGTEGSCEVPPRNKRLEIQLLEEIGNFRITDLVLAKEAVRPFTNRAYLIDEQDPQIRRAIDTALTKRMYGLIIVALENAVPASSEWVRADAIRGLKTLGVYQAQDTIIRQLEVDTRYGVRAEAVEYLGAMGDARSVATLLPLIRDGDSNIRFKARQSLGRIAGVDYGMRQLAWIRWAHGRYSEIDEEGNYVEPEFADDVVPDPTPLPEPADSHSPLPPPTPTPVDPNLTQPVPQPPPSNTNVAARPNTAPVPAQPVPASTGPLRPLGTLDPNRQPSNPTMSPRAIGSPPPPPPPGGSAQGTSSSQRTVSRRATGSPPPPPPPPAPRR